MKSLIKLALLFLTTLTLFACGGSSGGGSDAPAPTATPAPVITKLTIANAQAGEGENIIFTVTATPNIAKAISFNYRINFDNPITSTSAQANDLSGDFSGTKTSTIAANSNSTTISIPIVNDTFKEKAETFRIVLSNLAPTTDATFTNNKAIGTIESSDPDKVKTILSIVDSQAGEGENITFTVTSAQAIAEQISFKYRIDFDNPLTPDSASPADLSGQLTGTSTIDINTTSTTFSIATVNDSLREKAESFSVILSDLSPSDATFTDYIGIGTITANDESGIVTISVADAEANEDSGTINFRVSSAFPATTGSPFTFGYEAIFGSGPTYASSDDFDGATSGTATIDADSSSTTIAIKVATDDTIELNETFSLRLTNPSSNATLDSANNSAMGTILNDDLGEISNQTASIGDTAITLSWTNPNSNLFAGVTIAQATSDAAPLSCETATNVKIIDDKQTPAIIDNLTNGSTYSFRICARSTSGSLSSGVELADLTLTVVDQDKDGLIDITTATQLYNIRYNLDGTGYRTSRTSSNNSTGDTIGCPNGVCSGYELMNDIDLSSFNDGTWDPIGSNSDNNRFTAILEGNDNTISNLTIDDTTDNYIGIFGTMQLATVRNLKITDVSIDGGDNIGALVGQATNSILSNIELIEGEIKANGNNIGGLVGSFSGTITDSSSSLTIIDRSKNSISSAGGLVGHLQSGSIKNSNSSGNLSSNGSNSFWYGGLVGQNDATISNSWASGNLSNNNGNGSSYYGGLVGWNKGNISNSWASGSINIRANASENFGGLVGWNDGNISNGWASGNILNNGASNAFIGGLVGQNRRTISNSWASGNILNNGGNPFIGGLVGSNRFEANGMVQFFNINGRNYQIDHDTGTGVTNSTPLGDGAGNSIHGLTALAALSGASGDIPRMNSDWHAGFDLDNADNDASSSTGIDLKTRYCDTNKNGNIDEDEQMATNSVWVMPSIPTGSDNVPAPDTNGDGNADFYAIPAIRCIGDTKGKTSTEINAIRKANIDRQRLLFPRND